MASWSPENATKAYLQALKMGNKCMQPDIAEFISALAAGNNAKLMVLAATTIAGSITLSLVAAAHQTGGQVVCILPTKSDLHASRHALATHAYCIEFVTGDAKTLLLNDYKEADFVLIDCTIDDCKGVVRAAQECGKRVIVGYNAFHKSPWPSEIKIHFLPIGEGLVVTRIGNNKVGDRGGDRKRSKWITRVDKCTGEEHVFRVISPHQEAEA